MNEYHHTLQRLTWRHINSGEVIIQGAGKCGNRLLLTTADATWLNDMFENLEFRLEEWNKELGQWVEVDGNE